MIKHISKLIWMQRKNNGWLLAELGIVFVFLWVVLDMFLVDLYTYLTPMGYDIDHVYRLEIGKINRHSPDYIPPGQLTTTEADDLLALLNQAGSSPRVEAACLSYYSCPYSRGASYEALKKDSTVWPGLRVRQVTPGYFYVFRISDLDGERILPTAGMDDRSLILSPELAALLFSGERAVGKKLYYDNGEDNSELIVKAVCTSQRATDIEKAVPCFYRILTGQTWQRYVRMGATAGEMFVRVKPEADRDFIRTYREESGARLQVNNLFVKRIYPVSRMREQRLASYRTDVKMKFSLIGFVLLNVFFGIIGTFWLRTQYRRGEIGLRMAVGANRRSIFGFLMKEGLLLLTFAALLAAAVYIQVIWSGRLDTYRMPYSAWRFLLTFAATYLILAVMILAGVWYPARETSRIQPAEALHEE